MIRNDIKINLFLLRNKQKQLVNTPIDGRTAMHLAADYGQLEVLEYITSQGADINAKDKHGISVILAAIWEGHANCVKFLLDKVLHSTAILKRYWENKNVLSTWEQ